ncbi:hypothetical protein BAE44_0026185 [Dichanthelium oligosanthes]|uniref:Uncharacterized protein n=1 Tax=Dichanthelium oligosanthes TaxID=888268 RepID=A0A1E5UIT9_9POAL|nr:hypothetical protein BAE44_0026185 [Dichanthelium oligosanthes]
MAPRLLPLVVVALLLLVLAVAVQGEGDAPRLRGSVACLDCAAGHDLSGVVVAVKCAGGYGGDDGAGLHAAQTDGRGAFDVAMPTAASLSSPPATPCAARVLGGTEQLCAPRGLAVARVVPDRAPGSSYALGSRLAFFTRCRPASGGSAAVATTMDAADDQQQQGQGDAPRVRVPEPRPMPPAMRTPASPPPRAGGNDSPPFGMGGGLPLIYFFPFIPIIGIP